MRSNLRTLNAISLAARPTAFLYITILVIILFLGGCTNRLSIKPEGSIKIGVIGAFSGNLANLAADERLGLEIAADEINANGGVNGIPIKLLFEDGKCDPKEATTAATKLTEVDDVKVILGGTCTGESMAIAKVATDKKIVQLSAVTSGSVYSTTGEWTFRSNPVDNAGDLVTYLLSKGYRRFALLNENTDFSQSIRKDFKTWVTQGASEVVADENYDTKDSDYRTQLAKLHEARPDMYFLNPQSGPTGVTLAKQAKELGLSPLFGSRAFEAARASDFPNELEGIIFYGTAGVVNMQSPQAKGLFFEYEKRTGKKPFSAFAVASRYDDLNLISQSMKTCGQEPACIKDWMYAMKPYQGVIGTFTFDQNGDPIGVRYAFSQFKGGNVLQLK